MRLEYIESCATFWCRQVGSPLSSCKINQWYVTREGAIQRPYTNSSSPSSRVCKRSYCRKKRWDAAIHGWLSPIKGARRPHALHSCVLTSVQYGGGSPSHVPEDADIARSERRSQDRHPGQNHWPCLDW
jgi:hypothetical protein